MPSIRFNGLEKALETVVSNGLRQGWINLGHNDSEVLKLVGGLPGQRLALRQANGEDNDPDVPVPPADVLTSEEESKE